MKKKNWTRICVLAIAFAAVGVVQAGLVEMEFISMSPGTEVDVQYTEQGNALYYGAVDTYYEIGKYEVTVDQFNAFRNSPEGQAARTDGSVLEDYWSDGTDGSRNVGGDAPVVNVSLNEAMQYCNWLTSGDPERGAYTFIDGTAGTYALIDRDAAAATLDGNNGNWVYVLPTENEWYRAAYRRPDGSGFSDFSNGADDSTQNETPIAKVDDSNADYTEWTTGWNYDTKQMRDAGFGTMEQNGTFNMNGNVFEWLEQVVYGSDAFVFTAQRGGTAMKDYAFMASGYREGGLRPWQDDYDIGFRIARVVPIPEPMTIGLAMIGGCVAWFARLKQRV
jgi:formylglycine-generating enzyme required for sulfatase activity